MTNYIVIHANKRDFNVFAKRALSPSVAVYTPDTRIARNGDTRVARNGDTRVTENTTVSYTAYPIEIRANPRNFAIYAPFIERV